MAPHGARYIENQVLSADPVGLVVLLYEGAIEALLRARTSLQEGNIPERSAAISKAMEIVLELQSSLDHENGGEIANGLVQLYSYIQERLAVANAQQQPAPLEEALNLLMVVYESWKEIAAEPKAPLPAGGAISCEPVCQML